MDLEVDTDRQNGPETGIYVRAKNGKNWVSADIAELNKASLLQFLRQRGGDNQWAEDVVGILLGHGHLHARPPVTP